MARILHWIPAYNVRCAVAIVDQVRRDTLIAVRNGHEHEFQAEHSCDLVHLRNKALRDAMERGYDYLLMQDADVYSPAPRGPLEPLLAALEKTGATMAGALVTLRTRPPKANVWPCYPGKAYQCEKLGTGIVLIDLNKLREWYPSFDGPCFYRTYSDPACAVADHGLDIYFCRVIQKHGGFVVCDARIPTVHIDATHPHFYNGESAPDMADAPEERTEPDLGLITDKAVANLGG